MVKAAMAAPSSGGSQSDPEDEVNDLMARHRELERKIATLDHHLALSSAEQIERTRLKKEKLWVKDRMQALQARTTLTG